MCPLFRTGDMHGVRGTASLTENDHSELSSAEDEAQFDSIEDAMDAFKKGEFIIVLDSRDRENEGDLIISGEGVTEKQMAFLVRYTSGLVCAAISREIANRLALPQMVSNNTDPKKTAYTVSLDSSHPSITTDISAYDRALTCRTLASATAGINDFRRPGHIMPLEARDGGVRERSGHTEAAIEFCRLAKKPLVGVLAELVKDGDSVDGVAEIENGGMMRGEECLRFGKKWGIKVCTIEDLVKYLEKGENGGRN